jgi:hypothetical protein
MQIHKGGEAATKAYSPTKGHSVVIYTHKFKPEHFGKAAEIVEKFPKAQQSKGKQKRLNVFLKRPSTHEIVNISFFDGPDVQEWHESKDRVATLKELEDKLEKPIDVQVFEVVDAVGVG